MALTLANLPIETDLPEEALSRVLATAQQLVAKYAPGAPEPVAEEATIRIVGFMVQSPAAALRAMTDGDFSEQYAVSRRNPLLDSGAASILAPWREHRAGAI